MRIIEMEQLLNHFMDFINREEIGLVSVSEATPMEDIFDYDPLINKFLVEREAMRMARLAPAAPAEETVTK